MRGRGTNEVRGAGGQAVYGALRANAVAAADELTALGCDWARVESIQFDFEADTDGSVRCTRQTLTDADGLTAVNLRPETVYVADGCRSSRSAPGAPP